MYARSSVFIGLRGWRYNWRETGLSDPGEIIYKPPRLTVLDATWKLKRKESHEVKVKDERKEVKKVVQRETEMLVITYILSWDKNEFNRTKENWKLQGK
jgi:hypothetical protein